MKADIDIRHGDEDDLPRCSCANPVTYVRLLSITPGPIETENLSIERIGPLYEACHTCGGYVPLEPEQQPEAKP